MSETRSKREAAAETAEEFELPQFDEERFVLHEIRDAKLAVLTVGFAFVAALATRLLHFALDHAALPFLIGLAAAALLKPLAGAAQIELEEFTTKNWVGLVAIYFFSWLGFWTVLINPPFA